MKTILLLILTFALFGCGDDYLTSPSECLFPEHSIIQKYSNGNIACVKCFNSQYDMQKWKETVICPDMTTTPSNQEVNAVCECMENN